jgi:hypothetical protein
MIRPARRAAGLAALAGLLFLQVAIAFAPCAVPGRAAATTMAVAMASMPECQQGGLASMGLAHCTAEDQAVIAVALPELPDLSLPPLKPAIFERKDFAVAPPIPPYRAAAGPPPRILFQSFLL